MTHYRTRVESPSTGPWVSYHGVSLEGALDALHAYRATWGELVVCEARNGTARWVPLVTVHGGRPRVCDHCGGTGDGSKPERVCRQCGGLGVV